MEDVHLQAASAATPRPVALRATDVRFAYRDGRRVLDGVSLEVKAGETVALMGPSGCGKTTLLKVLAGVLPCPHGRVSVLGERRRRDGAVGYIPQQLGLVRNASALENVLAGSLSRVGAFASLFGVYPAKEEDVARRILARVGLADKADRRVASLSGGERQRVAIARTILQRPGVLLADEFTANLDVVKAGQILDLVREATARGVATVVALHNPALACEYADRVVFMRDGRIVETIPAANLTPESARELLG